MEEQSGFSLVEVIVSMAIVFTIFTGIFSIAGRANNLYQRIERFYGKVRPELMLSRIGEEIDSSFLLKRGNNGWDYYKATGLGFGQSKKCILLFGKKSKYMLSEGKVINHCREGEFFLFAREKRLYLAGKTLYMEVSGKPQPLEDEINEFNIEEKTDFIEITINGKTSLRKIK
ncbi:MAG: prepilin-type N-terminal cleavage/methylation domain-containing protein [Candidatus Aminicenantes bacterium]|nr:prepilin-type N-terminal cleavage/methylation domain-containing protein [Candidatus Aminicenantes bacterium]